MSVQGENFKAILIIQESWQLESLPDPTETQYPATNVQVWTLYLTRAIKKEHPGPTLIPELVRHRLATRPGPSCSGGPAQGALCTAAHKEAFMGDDHGEILKIVLAWPFICLFGVPDEDTQLLDGLDTLLASKVRPWQSKHWIFGECSS